MTTSMHELQPTVADELHPRPQMRRAMWHDLRGMWAFAYDDSDRGLAEHWQRRTDVFTHTIHVPYPPEAPLSGIGDTAFHPVMWYRRAASVARPAGAGRVLLHFGAIDYRAQVWVNEHLVASHEGGHTPFSIDITDVLLPGDVQVIVVRAEDQPADLAQPRGKQDWHLEPHDIWYHRTSGIWQPVWIEQVGEAYLAAIRWTPDLDRLAVGLSVKLQRHTPAPLQLSVRLSVRGQVLVHDTCTVTGTALQRTFTLDAAGLHIDPEQLIWSPGHPTLIDAALTLLCEGEVCDQVDSYFGLRSAGVANGHFYLNGRPYFLRLALEQGYWPESHLAVCRREEKEEEVRAVEEAWRGTAAQDGAGGLEQMAEHQRQG